VESTTGKEGPIPGGENLERTAAATAQRPSPDAAAQTRPIAPEKRGTYVETGNIRYREVWGLIYLKSIVMKAPVPAYFSQAGGRLSALLHKQMIFHPSSSPFISLLLNSLSLDNELLSR